MLINKKIRNSIEAEIKAQKSLLKLLENQESNYGTDLSNEKEEIAKTIIYYDKVLKEAV